MYVPNCAPLTACSARAPTRMGVALSPSLEAFFAGRALPSQTATPPVRRSGTLRGVGCCAPCAVPVATVSRSTYDAAGVDTGQSPEGPTRPTGQVRTGGRLGSKGRPTDTRRNTWGTLGPGMQRAVCKSLLNRGLEPVLRGLYGRSPPDEVHEHIHNGLTARARVLYRGEVWPLRGVFGVLSRFPAGVAQGVGGKMMPTVVTTWLTDVGTIACSCVRRVAFSARQGRVSVDETCQHAMRFRGATSYLADRLGVSLATVRRVVPGLFGDEYGAGAGNKKGDQVLKEADWDAEGILEAFRTGQTAVAVVLSDRGSCKVPAPVRCSRKTSTCEFCDTAAGFSCIHDVRARSVRRDQPTVKDAADEDGGTVVDDSRSTQPLPVYNCPKSVRVDAMVCANMLEGKIVVVRAPRSCPMCGAARKADCKIDDGEIISSEGYATFQLESFFCDGKECERWVFPDGRAEGLVILSCTTAATVLIMRDMASEMVSSESPFKAGFKHWTNQFMDRRDSGAYPKMRPVAMRCRKTITSLFFWTLELMTKEPPPWAFRCGKCQDKDGRFRIVTADGIWLGYLKRLASARYTSPAEVCTSVQDGVRAASIHPSEWVRRFLRMTLKQPSKQLFIKAVQLNSAKRALAFLSSSALPHFLETELPEERREQLVRLRALLGRLWDLDLATVSLVNGILVGTKKLLKARTTLAAAVVSTHLLTIQRLNAWKLHIQQGEAGAAGPGGVAPGVNNGGGGDGMEGGGPHGDGAAGDDGEGSSGAEDAEDGLLEGEGAAPEVPLPAVPAAAPRGRAAGANAVRRPAATARRHHMDRSTNEPMDPRYLRPSINALGVTV